MDQEIWNFTNSSRTLMFLKGNDQFKHAILTVIPHSCIASLRILSVSPCRWWGGSRLMGESLAITQTAVTDTAFKDVLMSFRKFLSPWIQGDKIIVILTAPYSLFVAFHIFRNLMEGFVYFSNSPFNWLHNMWNCVLHVINNLKMCKARVNTKEEGKQSEALENVKG